nr:putative ribonuclease H-like domain-containing protein [Tanacetum cinerariifolium]
MSSDSHATITYTSMSSYGVIINGYYGMPMDPLDPYVQLVMGAPPSPDYIPRPEAPPSTDYIPGPEYPEYLPPADDMLPAEEQPLPAAVSPTAESPGHITDGGDNDANDDSDDLSEDDDDDEDEEDESIPEADIPLWKRARFTTPTSRYKIGESSVAAAARQIRHTLTIADKCRADDKLIGKFDGKADEGFLIGYFVSSKAFRVFNSRTRIVQETLHINFLENQPNVAGSGPTWLFDIDTLTQSMNYQPVVAGNQPNSSAGIQENLTAGTGGKEVESVQQYVLLPLWSSISKDPRNTDAAAFEVKEPESEVHVPPSSSDKTKKHVDKTKIMAKGKSPVELSTGVRNLSGEFEKIFVNNTNGVNAVSTTVTTVGPNLTNSTNSFSAVGPSNTVVSPTFKIGGKSLFVDPSHYPDDPNMPKLEDITYSDDEEDVGFEDPDYPDKVYKLVKALYGLHQALRAWYETLANYLLENGFQRGKIDQTLFIKKQKGDILLVHVSVDDIIFGSTNKELCKSFEKLMKDKFQMSSMGELTFFLGLQVKKKEDGIFISQDKYVAEILRKFGLTDGKSVSIPIDTKKPLLKDPDGDDVDVHIYRSMIGSLMYLTSSRTDIMFAVYACVRFQVTPKVSHLHAVKRIFRYVKGKPHLGLWYPKDSPFNLVAYSDSDYAGASLDRKSTTGGCQFLGCRLIYWQCKKQTVVATSSSEVEYVVVASYCAQVLWIQN